jgi:hypothetical protein
MDKSTTLRVLQTLPPQSTGFQLDTLSQSRTKVNAVLAGLSPPLAQMSHPGLFPTEKPLSTIFLSSNSFLALVLTATEVATVAGTTTPGTI